MEGHHRDNASNLRLALAANDGSVLSAATDPGGFVISRFEESILFPSWEARPVGAAGGLSPMDILVSVDGERAFVTGVFGSGAAASTRTVAVATSDGAPIWSSSLDSAVGGGDWGWALTQSADGTILFEASQTWGGAAASWDVLVRALQADSGQQLWERRLDSGGGDEPIRLFYLADSDALLVWAYLGGTDALTSLDASTGLDRWLLAAGVGPLADLDVSDVAVTGGGSTVIVGANDIRGVNLPSLDGGVTLLSFAGVDAQPIWQSSLPQFVPAAPRIGLGSISVDDDRVYWVGTVAETFVEGFVGFGPGVDAIVAAYALDTGALAWVHRLVGDRVVLPVADETGLLVAAPGFGAVYVAGLGTSNEAEQNAFVYRLEAASGMPVWKGVYDLGGASVELSTFLALRATVGDVVIGGPVGSPGFGPPGSFMARFSDLPF